MASNTRTRNKAQEESVAEKNDVMENAAAVDAPEEKPKPKEIDLHEYVSVRNGFQGRLVYVSKRTGERFVWDEFGDEQEMELLELKNAKNSNKKFFENNWFMFDEKWIPDFLGVTRYYKYAIGIDEFDDLFEKTPSEIIECVSKLSDGQKKSVAYRARKLIANGGIDSNRAIAALEKSLGIELTEK